MESDNSRNSTFVGLFWSFIDLFSRHSITLIVQMILARILIPADFGILGMSMIFITLSHALVNSGFDQALIREDKIGDKELATVFYFNFIISILIYIVIYVTAPNIANFFNEEQLASVVRVLGIVVVINGLTIVQRVVLTRKLDFKLQTRITLISSIISGGIAIFLALNGAGVWSLVLQQVLMQLIISILLFTFVNWIPKPYFNITIFKRYFKFGYKLLLSGIVDTLNQNLPNIILGRLFSSTQLGYYTNANKISNIISSTVSHGSQRVFYPVLSSYKNNYDQLKFNHSRLLRILMLIYFPFLLLLMASASNLIPFIFGEQWSPSVIVFQILLIHAMFFPLNTLNMSLFKVINRTDIFLKMHISSLLILLLMLAVIFLINPTYISIVATFSLHSIVYFIMTCIVLKVLIDYKVFNELKILLKVLLGSSLYYLIGILINNLVDYNYFINIIIQYSIAIPVGLFFMSLICRKEFKLLIKLIKSK